VTNDLDRLGHMVSALRSIRRVATSRRALADETKQAAVLRWFEVLGEASKGVTASTKALAPSIPWAKLVGLRNVLIHGYDQVDLNEVWQAIAKTEALLADLERLLKRLEPA
jgi:uncharacterized protein with HEPN domain